MKITWDKNKNTLNKSKHGISFEAAQFVFDDPLVFSHQDRFVDGEEWWQAIGLAAGATLLVVAHTWIDDEPRLMTRIKNKYASSLQDAQTEVKGEVMKTDDELQSIIALRPIPESVRAELAALAEMSDEDIDYSDIPPTTHEDWVGAVRGKFYRPDAQFKLKED